jgi:hypothetical protein
LIYYTIFLTPISTSVSTSVSTWSVSFGVLQSEFTKDGNMKKLKSSNSDDILYSL